MLVFHTIVFFFLFFVDIYIKQYLNSYFIIVQQVEELYQTVTIVPSDTNPEEVSYILIVQQPESEEKESEPVENETIAATATAAAEEGEEAEGEQDLTVYDFEDNEDNEAPVESEAEDDKTKIVKFLPKKSQTVTQAHMCNYCNYTSPKRYCFHQI